MKDLSQISGIGIKLEDIGLVFDQENFPVEPKTRMYSEAKDVYVEKEAQEQELYYMYRYFEGNDQEGLFEKNKLEYDVTVLKAGLVGHEYIKTSGHYHGYVPGTEITYPEVYEVIEGEIEYLLQTHPDAEGNVDVVVVSAQAGDKVVVPPNYGHISINKGADIAVSSNLQFRDLPATADYETLKTYLGGALFLTDKGWENNDQYNIRSLKKVTPREKFEWGLQKDKPLYTSFIESPEKFDFLVNPQNYDFKDVWSERQL
jgi:glucose-6-phosphate isomerase, archaeal